MDVNEKNIVVFWTENSDCSWKKQLSKTTIKIVFMNHLVWIELPLALTM